MGSDGQVLGFCERCLSEVRAVTVREAHEHHCTYAQYCTASLRGSSDLKKMSAEEYREKYHRATFLRTCYQIQTAEDRRQTQGLTVCDRLTGQDRADYDLCGDCSNHYWS